ncbi:MAG: lytic transglycosylase domain-containing protein [Bacillota bacterium]
MSRILFLAVLVLLIINAGNIGRFFMPIPYRDTIFREAANSGIDGYLLAAMVKTESNFNPGAVSVKGARGLMQIMPETGRWVAGQRGIPNYSPELLFNPEFNVKIGALYVADLYKEYNGDTVLVLAAYNAGRGNVKKWIEENYWTGKRGSLDQIPFPETRQFIRKVLFYQQAYSYLYNMDTAGEK